MLIADKYKFYGDQLEKWIPEKDASILVIGAGFNDRRVLEARGYTNVVLTDLDSRGGANDDSAYRWERQDAEHLTYGDGRFDYVIVNAALHHCASPHRALLEMYRVARRGIVAVEARDSILMRTAIRMGLTGDFELDAVRDRDGKSGGVANTQVPNFIYRWTEREIRKTINSFRPDLRHHFEFAYASQVGQFKRLAERGPGARVLAAVISRGFNLFTILCPRQQNLFAFHVRKPAGDEGLQPWLRVDNGELVFDGDYRGRS